MKRVEEKNSSALSFFSSGRRRGAYRCALGVSIALLVVWAVFFAIMVFGAISALAVFLSDSSIPANGVTFIIYGCTILDGAIILLIFAGLVSAIRHVGKSTTPFEKKQVKRIHLLAFLLLIYAILDSFFAEHLFALFLLGLQDIGYNGISSIVFDRPWFIPELNIGAFVAAIVVWCISLVFEYGIELQLDSDSIL